VMYAHGICSIALCEAYAMTQDRDLRAPAQKAIDYIIYCQNPGGGWRYEPKQQGDTSVVGWQLMALRSAQMAYLDVPDDAIKRAVKFLDSVAEREPGDRYGLARYAYQPGTGISEVMTAEAMLCRQYTGWKRSEPAMGDAVRWLISEHLPSGNSGFNVYYFYYGTQVMHHYGGEPWKAWNNRVRDLLVNTQVKRGELEGSWDPRGQWGNQGGRIFTTSLSLLTLEVYYRHLPLYDRPEKDLKGD
ncbi:MAG TPA: prenyltransferase/squalene oxidase repeat-containing protein, partial [Pirellulales bacterium]